MMEKRTIIIFALLVLASSIFLFSVPFSGNYPLNDDVYYSQVVLNFINGNWVFTIAPIANTTLLHALYGFAFSKLFGPLLQGLGPYALLRLSIMALSIFYVVLAFFFGRLMKLSDKESAGLAMLLLTNPVVFNMAHTFMTDITFSFFFLLGAHFYLKGFGNPGNRELVIGSAFAGASILVRQVGILLPAGALLVLFYKTKFRPRIKQVLSILGLPVVAFAAGVLYWFYFVMGGLYNFFPVNGLQYGGMRLSKIALNTAFYVFPLALLSILNFRLEKKKLLVFAAVLLFAVPFVVFDQLKYDRIFPFIRNTIGERGVGTVYMAPAYTAEAGQWAFAPWQLWVFLVASLFLLAHSVSSVSKSFLREEAMPLLLAAPYFLMMLVVGIFFDRYLMPIFPFLFYLAIKYTRGREHRLALLSLTILVFGLISWHHTSIYLNLHQANWSGIDFLLSAGIPREKIDGGLEFCTQNRFGGLIPKGTIGKGSVSGWCESSDYVTSLEPIAGYTALNSFDYLDPFGRVVGRVFVLKKPQ